MTDRDRLGVSLEPEVRFGAQRKDPHPQIVSPSPEGGRDFRQQVIKVADEANRAPGCRPSSERSYLACARFALQQAREQIHTIGYRPPVFEVTLQERMAFLQAIDWTVYQLDRLLAQLASPSVPVSEQHEQIEKDQGAGLAAAVNDTGSSTTETASGDARVCPQDGKVCWEPGCEVEYCKGRYEGREAAFGEVTAHWFLQGGEAEFGPIGKDKIISGDSLVSDILQRVRALARPARHVPANEFRALVNAVVMAWHALRVEEVRVWGPVRIDHAGRCGRETNALMEAIEALATCGAAFGATEVSTSTAASSAQKNQESSS